MTTSDRRSTEVATLVILGLVAAGLGAFAHLDDVSNDHSLEPTVARVHPTVLSALESDSYVRVLVGFSIPGLGLDDYTSEAGRAAIAETTEAVIDSMPVGAFAVTGRYDVVPGMALEVNRDALDALVAHERVESVALDVGGVVADLEAGNVVGQSTVVNTLGFTGMGMTVAILDTGIDTTNVNLQGVTITEACFAPASACPLGVGSTAPGSAADVGANEHGTITAQLIAGSANMMGCVIGGANCLGPGLAPNASLLAIQVFNNTGTFSLLSNWTAALNHILANRPDVNVVNMSIQSTIFSSGSCDAMAPAFATAVNMLTARGTVVVAATGNVGNKAQISLPSCVGNVISVGASWDGPNQRDPNPSQMNPDGTLRIPFDYVATQDGPTPASCGNGVIDAMETCDDGNTANDDGCSTECLIEPFSCTQTGTTDTVACFSNSGPNLDMLAPGVSALAVILGGQPGVSAGTSDAAPLVSACIADMLQADPTLTAGEVLTILGSSPTVLIDPANSQSTPRLNCADAVMKSAMMAMPVCGNGMVEAGEQCDDGNTMSGDGCSSTCQNEVAVCGNGMVEAGEQCDDGNTMSGDGCSSTCQNEMMAVCGNGMVESGEQCDDGNTMNGDGCSSTCQNEVAMCGNNVVESGELCDDGNTFSGDGCSSKCLTELAFNGAPSTVNSFGGFATVNQNTRSADDFVMSSTTTPTVLRWYSSHLGTPPTPGEAMAVQIHNDNNGEPGSVVANMAVPNVVRESTGLITSGGRPIFAYEVNYTGPLLTSGTRYWMSVQKTDTGDPDFLWLGSNVNAGNAMFQVGSGAWNLLNTTGVELAFAVMPEPGVAASALTALLTLVGLHARARRKRM